LLPLWTSKLASTRRKRRGRASKLARRKAVASYRTPNGDSTIFVREFQLQDTSSASSPDFGPDFGLDFAPDFESRQLVSA
jgi:hypothetical protein